MSPYSFTINNMLVFDALNCLLADKKGLSDVESSVKERPSHLIITNERCGWRIMLPIHNEPLPLSPLTLYLTASRAIGDYMIAFFLLFRIKGSTPLSYLKLATINAKFSSRQIKASGTWHNCTYCFNAFPSTLTSCIILCKLAWLFSKKKVVTLKIQQITKDTEALKKDDNKFHTNFLGI